MVVLALFATLMATAAGYTATASAQDTVTCWAIADGTENNANNNEDVNDTLVRIDDALGAASATIVGGEGGLTTTDAEAMAIRPGDGPNYIWAWESSQLVVINPANGAVQNAPFNIPGKVEGLTWANVDDADLTNDVLYAIQTNGDVIGYDDGGAVLVIMEYWNVGLFFEAVFYIEAARGGDVFEVDAAKGWLKLFDDVDNLVRVLCSEANWEGLYASESLE